MSEKLGHFEPETPEQQLYDRVARLHKVAATSRVHLPFGETAFMVFRPNGTSVTWRLRKMHTEKGYRLRVIQNEALLKDGQRQHRDLVVEMADGIPIIKTTQLVNDEISAWLSEAEDDVTQALTRDQTALECIEEDALVLFIHLSDLFAEDNFAEFRDRAMPYIQRILAHRYTRVLDVNNDLPSEKTHMFLADFKRLVTKFLEQMFLHHFTRDLYESRWIRDLTHIFSGKEKAIFDRYVADGFEIRYPDVLIQSERHQGEKIGYELLDAFVEKIIVYVEFENQRRQALYEQESIAVTPLLLADVLETALQLRQKALHNDKDKDTQRKPLGFDRLTADNYFDEICKPLINKDNLFLLVDSDFISPIEVKSSLN